MCGKVAIVPAMNKRFLFLILLCIYSTLHPSFLMLSHSRREFGPFVERKDNLQVTATDEKTEEQII